MKLNSYQLSYSLVGVVLIGLAISSSAFGQGGFAQSELNRLKNSSRASFYSIEREQSRNITSSITRAGVGGVNRQNFTGGLSSVQSPQRRKPFAGVTQGPTVSPYLSLSGRFATASDFQSSIRPSRDAERARIAQQRRDIQNQRRLNQLAAQPAINITGNQDSAPTGHSAVFLNNAGSFQNTGGYYPPPSRPRRGR